ncbi:MAG: hypothetical protein ACK5L8_07435 [Marinicella pacifica]
MDYYQHPQPKQPITWSTGKQWLMQSIKLFQQMQKHWYATLLILGLAVMILSMLSVQVALMFLMLVMPVITAWYYLLCRRIQTNPQQTQVPGQLWLHCRNLLLTRLNALLILGVLAVALNYAMHAVQLMLLEAMQLPVLTQETAAEITFSEALLRLLVSVLSGLPVALLMAFSPALVIFNDDSPIQAMIRSVKTVLFAWQAILSLTLWLMLLSMAAAFVVSIVMSILANAFGSGFIAVFMLFFMGVMMGVVFSANYVTYDALYPDPDDIDNVFNINHGQDSIYKEI